MSPDFVSTDPSAKHRASSPGYGSIEFLIPHLLSYDIDSSIRHAKRGPARDANG